MNYLKLFSIGLFLMSLISLTSCNSGENENAEVKTYTGSVSKESAQNLLEIYFVIKDALVETDAEKTKEGATLLLEQLNQIENKDETINAMIKDSKQIAEATEADAQRKHLNALSDNLLSIVKATGANNTEIYRQYCPMALDNAGAYWLSMSDEIKNPYFGDMMLKCGKVVETIE